MKPKIIMHNSVSLDGSFTGFDVDMALHYQTAADFCEQARLIGSKTVVTGIEMYGGPLPVETQADFHQPSRGVNLPYWIIVDSRGATCGLLHVARRFEYCRDVIVLVSNETPQEFRRYLEERNYTFLAFGKDRVDLRQAILDISERYNMEKILVDSGPELAGILVELGLLDEISLLVEPVLTGVKDNKLLSLINRGRCNIGLKLLSSTQVGGGRLHLRYRLEKPAGSPATSV